MIMLTHLVESHGLVLVEGLEAILVDRREMDKDILGSIIRSDETESFVREELRLGEVVWKEEKRHKSEVELR